MRKGQVDLNPENTFVITIDIVEFLSLSPWFFPLSRFPYIFIVYAIDFSVILLYSLPYFGAQIDFLGITHCILCFHWDLFEFPFETSL